MLLQKKEMPLERRRYRRVPFKMAVYFKSLNKGEVSRSTKSHSADFSAGGLAMHSQQKMRRGQMLMLNLFIPVHGRMKYSEGMLDYTKSRCQTTAILSRVAYCLKTTDAYKLGVQFLDLEKNHRKLLKSFLVKCQLLKSTSRLYS
ncbi:PilZ domain-containing protein [candidate division FCPU426 bacterium]|nr:PilZ domain-containing protein [candidate division FCPU426 bacterium]